MKKFKTDKWSDEENEKFYMAISIYGTDFALVSSLFGPSKTREQIKNKFKKEEKKNKEKIDGALKNPESFKRRNFEEKFGKRVIAKKEFDEEKLREALMENQEIERQE